jgi:pilus assembly protein CpaF
MAEFLKACVKARANILICGPRLAGKTSLMNTLGNQIDANERLITVQHCTELRFSHEHWIRLEANTQGGPSATDLIQAAVEMRPDRLFLSELKDDECLCFLKSLFSGVRGAITTMRADSADDCLEKLEAKLLFADPHIDKKAAKKLITSTIQLVIEMKYYEGGFRCISAINELELDEGGALEIRPIFQLMDFSTDAQGTVMSNYNVTRNPKILQRIRQEGIPFEL